MSKLPCDSCHAGCCRSFAVAISGADILRLIRETEKSFWDFVCRWADPEGAIAGKFAPTFRFEDEPQTPFVLCLRTVASQQFPGTTRCVFLQETATPNLTAVPGQLPVLQESPARCSVHPDRPGTCRAFPLTLSPDLDFAVINQVPEYGRADQDPAYKLCPRQWTPGDVDPLDSMRDLVSTRYEMQFFHSLANAWNRKPGPWALFPEFLNIVYSGRVQSGVEMLPVSEVPPTTIPFNSSKASARRTNRRAA